MDHRRVRNRILMVAMTTCLGVFGCGGPQVSSQRAATLIFPERASDQMIWPHNRAWVWSINRLDKLSYNSVSVVVRSVREPLQGKSPTIGSRIISKETSQAELSPGTLVGGEVAPPIEVSVQLVDLTTAGIPAGDPKRPLRLLLRLKHGGTETHRDGEQSVLDGDFVAGHSIHADAEWTDGELHLMNLFVQSKDELTTFDVVLVLSKSP